MRNIDIINDWASPSKFEVFTPNKRINEVLDMFPKEIWNNKNIKFLNPCCKSGGFLNEIVSRLMMGLKNEITDEQERLKHILKNQIFGIVFRETSLLYTRRILYKNKDIIGNIEFKNIEDFDKKKNKNYKEMIKNMKFDIIVGNPPYNNGMYTKFTDFAIDLNPQYISYIMPTNWYNSDVMKNTRDNLIGQNQIKILHDFNEVSDTFPGVNISNGICYFLWDKNYNGKCNFYEHRNNNKIINNNIYLKNKYTQGIIRYNSEISLQIIEKINPDLDQNFSKYFVIGSKFTNLESNFTTKHPYSTIKDNNNRIKLFVNDKIHNKNKDDIFIKDTQIPNYTLYKDLIDNKYKIYIAESQSGTEGREPLQIIPIPEARIGDPMSCCTGNFFAIGGFDTLQETNNVLSYMKTKFFRFLILLQIFNKHFHKSYFSLIPIQDWNQSWDDQKLYKKYNLSQEEINFIESMITKL